MPFLNNAYRPPPLYGNRYQASPLVPYKFLPPPPAQEAPTLPIASTGSMEGGQAAAPVPAPMATPPQQESGGHYEREQEYQNNRRVEAAKRLGHMPGQGNLGKALGAGLGFITGIPGLGMVADKIDVGGDPTEPRTVTREDGSTYTDHRSQEYGALGTYDTNSGAVFGGAGRGYDPITGRPMNTYANTDAAMGHIFGDDTPEISQGARDLGVSEGSVAGVMTQKGEDSIDNLLNDLEVEQDPYDFEVTPDLLPTTATGGTDLTNTTFAQTDAPGARPSEVIGQTSSGEDIHRPTGGGTVVTDRHGNAVTSTNQHGQKVAVTSPARDDNDSGGGGGGGK